MYEVAEELEDLGLDNETFCELDETLRGFETREERLAAIEDEKIRAVAARCPGMFVPQSYDFGTEVEEFLEWFCEDDPTHLAMRAPVRCRVASWIAQALALGEVWYERDTAYPNEDTRPDLDELAQRSALDVGEHLYALWASYLTGRDDLAKQLCGRGIESPSSLVRGATVLVRRALDGETKIGKVDLAPVRQQLIARAK